MRFLPSLGLAIVLAPASLFAQFTTTQNLSATLTGYQEVPAVSSDGYGNFSAVISISDTGASVRYAIQWANLADNTAPYEIDLNFGQENVNGGVLSVLCGGGGHVPCQKNIGRGAINPGDVLVINNQNIGTGDYDKFIRALFAGKVYVNIKTNRVPTGEIRGQIKAAAFQ